MRMQQRTPAKSEDRRSEGERVITVKGEKIRFCLQHEGAQFGIGHAEHRGLVRSESWEVVLRLNNAERAFSEGSECGFFVFLGVFMCAQKPLHTRENTDSTKRPTPDNAVLFTLTLRSCSTYSVQ